MKSNQFFLHNTSGWQFRRIAEVIATAVYVVTGLASLSASAASTMAQAPMTVKQPAPPAVLLSVGRDERLYYPAYNNYSDVDGDGTIDVDYKPGVISYYGLFDSNKCYNYSVPNSRFEPRGVVVDAVLKTCGASVAYSGDWLNYATTSRIDALRRVFYGGKRIETTTSTLLERAYIPQDAHSWGIEYAQGNTGYDIRQYTPFASPDAGRQHLFGNTTLNGSVNNPPLLRILLNRPERIFNWVAREGPVLNNLIDPGLDANGNAVGGGSVANLQIDRVVRVLVCVDDPLIPKEPECKGYPTNSPTVWRPTGLLHDYGENRTIAFGLMTGSYQNPRSGGVLRKNVGYFDQEVDATTGMFVTTSTGIVGSLDKLRISGWGPGYNCAGSGCRDYGNPIAEIMYEGLRYLGSGSAPTPAYSYTDAGSTDAALGLPLPAWLDLYRPVASGGLPVCAKPTQMVISDVNPTFDGDQVPGSSFGTFTGSASPAKLLGLSATTLGQSIWNSEGLGARNYFIGESLANTGNTYDAAPTPKLANSFGTIRGLSPGDPTRQGSYSAAAVANFGAKNPITTPSNTPVSTYAIALAPSIPTLAIPTGAGTISIAPFGKSVAGCNYGEFVSGTTFLTNRIVGYYFERVVNIPGFPADTSATTGNGGRPIGSFRVSFEDNEQGTDNDMDAIVRYNFKVNVDNSLTVSMKSEYAAGCIDQNMGFVISGTTVDGAILGVRDIGGGGANYFLNDSANSFELNVLNQRVAMTGNQLGLNYERTFTPSGASTAGGAIPQNPLWYAAKYGSIGAVPNTATSDPPNYAFVSNPAKLRAQIASALDSIVADAQYPSTVGASGSVVRTGTTLAYSSNYVYTTKTVPRRSGVAVTATIWSGGLDAIRLNDNGTLGNTVWSANLNGGTINTAPGVDYSTRPVITYINGAYRDLTLSNLNTDAALLTNFSPLDLRARLTPKLTEQFGATAMANAANLQRRTAEALANFIKGDQTLEIGNTPVTSQPGPLRVRENTLGDIVGSIPTYQGATDYGYLTSGMPGAGTYGAYVTAKRSRTELVWVGANDGMLHAFNARTGALVWSFLPRALQSRVANLANPSYTHEYFMNGRVSVADVYDGSNWKTIVVAAAGAGARTVVAIDATNPSDPAPLWEVNAGAPGQPFDDLGYVLGRLDVVRLNDTTSSTQWAVVFGNGYESLKRVGAVDKSVARLFILNALTGNSLGDSTKLTVPDSVAYNGLSSAALTRDEFSTATGSRAYVLGWAGDLGGNLWRYRLSGPPSYWGVESYSKSGTTARPLVRATRVPTGGSTALPQPITAEPTVVRALSDGYYVSFGTGKFFQDSDRSSTEIQSIFTIRDAATPYRVENSAAATIDAETNLTRSNLRKISIVSETGGLRKNTGASAAATQRGWYLDLVSPSSTSTDVAERVIAPPVTYLPFVYAGTFKPTVDSCESGSSGWFMAFDVASGLGETPFDVTGDGNAVALGSGAATNAGFDGPISLVSNAQGTKLAIVGLPVPYKDVSGPQTKIDRSTAKGGIKGLNTNAGRISWRQVQ